MSINDIKVIRLISGEELMGEITEDGGIHTELRMYVKSQVLMQTQHLLLQELVSHHFFHILKSRTDSLSTNLM